MRARLGVIHRAHQPRASALGVPGFHPSSSPTAWARAGRGLARGLQFSDRPPLPFPSLDEYPSSSSWCQYAASRSRFQPPDTAIRPSAFWWSR